MRKKHFFETQLTRLSLLSSIPQLIFLIFIMVYSEISIWLTLLAAMVGGILVIFANVRIHQKLVYQFRGLNNFLDALNHGDYTFRARQNNTCGELDKLILSINLLARKLSDQKQESVESQLLVQTIIDHIDVAIIALSNANQINFLNPAAITLLQLKKKEDGQKLIDQLAFVHDFSSGQQQVIELSLGHQQGKFSVHVEEFMESGVHHKLLFVTDVRTLLRGEERKAWKSLVRVISHEINNSLSPISSVSQTLIRLVGRYEIPRNLSTDLIEGLTLIAERADSLKQFVDSYKQLAKLPDPKKQMVSIVPVLEKIGVLFSEKKLEIKTKTDVKLCIDPVQFEQVLINLIKNASESMNQNKSEGGITIQCYIEGPFFKLIVLDQGTGIHNQDNLFVPFYSTKKHGSGIGLVLCRQIIEAHNGRLTIQNRDDGESGCRATIELPVEPVPLESV